MKTILFFLFFLPFLQPANGQVMSVQEVFSLATYTPAKFENQLSILSDTKLTYPDHDIKSQKAKV